MLQGVLEFLVERAGEGRVVVRCLELFQHRHRLLLHAGRRRVLVVTPGFTADCLETLDELGREAAETFRAAGGSELTLVPCVNDHPSWVEAMTDLARREAAPWTRE